MSSGERPIGAAKGKQPDTEALYQTPPHFAGEQTDCTWAAYLSQYTGARHTLAAGGHGPKGLA